MSQHAATQEDTDMAKSTEDRLSDLEKRVKELETPKPKKEDDDSPLPSDPNAKAIILAGKWRRGEK